MYTTLNPCSWDRIISLTPLNRTKTHLLVIWEQIYKTRKQRNKNIIVLLLKSFIWTNWKGDGATVDNAPQCVLEVPPVDNTPQKCPPVENAPRPHCNHNENICT